MIVAAAAADLVVGQAAAVDRGRDPDPVAGATAVAVEAGHPPPRRTVDVAEEVEAGGGPDRIPRAAGHRTRLEAVAAVAAEAEDGGGAGVEATAAVVGHRLVPIPRAAEVAVRADLGLDLDLGLGLGPDLANEIRMSKRTESHHRGRKKANGEAHLALGLPILAGAGPTPVLDRDHGASILVARDVDPVRHRHR